MHPGIDLDETLFVCFLEILGILVHLSFKLLLDVVTHKVGARVAVHTMTIENPEQDLLLIVVEFGYDLECVLIRLVQILWVVTTL